MSSKEEQKPSLCKSQDCALPVMGSSKSENKMADELCTQEMSFILVKKKDRYPTKDMATDCGFSSGCYLWHLSSVLLG